MGGLLNGPTGHKPRGPDVRGLLGQSLYMK